MAYTKTNWTDTTPINKTNLNKIDDGIYNSSRLSSTEPNPKNDIWFKSSKNLFNGLTESGGYSNSGNKVADASTVRNITPISVLPNTTYIWSNNGVSVGMNVLEYNSNNVFISKTVYSGAFTTSANTYYINVFKGSANTDKLQLEVGSSVSSYEAYVEPNILVNHGGGYQDLQDNRTDIITGVEMPTNEYIDGKRVYVKRINFGALPNTSVKTISHGITNAHIVRYNGIAYNGTFYLNIPSVNFTLAQMVNIFASNTEVGIQTGNDRSAYTECFVYIYYTKN